MQKLEQHGHRLIAVDDLSPEDIAMVQALYSRSAESAEVHIEKVRKTGSGKFMSTHYVGYGHKSIADCGTTTCFVENVSILAAKAIQDWPLYSGQETSTRYIDMGRQPIVDPVGTERSRHILNQWMGFYTKAQAEVSAAIRGRFPQREGEKDADYNRAVAARTFDTLRAFLPAGICTQLSWHTNLRQAGDHLLLLAHHPAAEMRQITEGLRQILHTQYPSSGAGMSLAAVSGVANKNEDPDRLAERTAWEARCAELCTYPQPSRDRRVRNARVSMSKRLLNPAPWAYELIESRPRGCVLPHQFAALGSLDFTFQLDFGSFRDIQRHRNGTCIMPLLSTDLGFESWYLDELQACDLWHRGEGNYTTLCSEAERLIQTQTWAIRAVSPDPVVRQYYTALGFLVPVEVSYGLPAATYVMELRSNTTVHPTLRKVIHEMVKLFNENVGYTLHADMSESDWDVRRGTQTITSRG